MLRRQRENSWETMWETEKAGRNKPPVPVPTPVLHLWENMMMDSQFDQVGQYCLRSNMERDSRGGLCGALQTLGQCPKSRASVGLFHNSAIIFMEDRE